jgi:Rod binding domain-containing protein
MSALSSATGFGGSLPAIDPALEPASVRNGNQAAKNAYQQGLAFEDVLVSELAQEMTSSAGLGGSDNALGAYSSLLPQALSSSVMSAGGTGLALQIAQSIDPALDAPATGGRA